MISKNKYLSLITFYEVNKPLRIAFFADSFSEVNGVAMTSQKLVGYARENGYPFLCVHAGRKTEIVRDRSVTYLSLKRSSASLALDEDLAYDPFFQRHATRVLRELIKFQPDVLHTTGLNDVSIIGSYMAWKLKIPSVASWHTNLHEFAAHRLERMFSFLPASIVSGISDFAEKRILDGAILYYRMPKVVLAPNRELLETLVKDKRRSTFLMTRGVDAERFSPAKRTANDGVFRFGFVGRLRAEKRVRLLADLERELLKAGKRNFKFLIVGEGNEREFLEKNMKTAEFTNFLEGERLSEAYANMDVFVFPSETETFGNVVQEANASGVPAIVTDRGGPKFIVRSGETGFVANGFDDFVKYSLLLMNDAERLQKMKTASREFALSRSWNSVFETVYRAYEESVRIQREEMKSK